MIKNILLPLVLIMSLLFVSCNPEVKKEPTTASEGKSTEIKYAEGFQIIDHDEYKVIEVKNPWPDAEITYRYILVEKGKPFPENVSADAFIEVPVERIIVTSTTHIPSLEMLGESDKIIGFPNTDYISSEETRKLVKEGKIKDIGKNEDINTEVVLELKPEVVIGFSVDGTNKTFQTLERAGIPVVYNGDWTETTPLGKAEWIKFFGAFFNKESLALNRFSEIAEEYLAVKKLAETASNRPTVLGGAMWKDIWYLPEGNSWAANFIADANARYLWEDSKGTGSLALNLETVLEKARDADYWIGPGQFSTYKQLEDASQVYTRFKAFKNRNVYSFSIKKGETGGVLYYELAPNRPDLVLKDLVKIFHPELLQEHKLYFFTPLD